MLLKQYLKKLITLQSNRILTFPALKCIANSIVRLLPDHCANFPTNIHMLILHVCVIIMQEMDTARNSVRFKLH